MSIWASDLFSLPAECPFSPFTVTLTVLATQSSSDVRQRLSSPHKLHQQLPSGIVCSSLLFCIPLDEHGICCHHPAPWTLVGWGSVQGHWHHREIFTGLSCPAPASVCKCIPISQPMFPHFLALSSLHLTCPAQKPCICPGDHNTHTRNCDELGCKHYVRLCDCHSTKLIWFKKRGSVCSGGMNFPVIMEESFLNTSIVLTWWIFALVSAAEGFWSILNTSAHLCVLSQCIWNHFLNLLYVRKVEWPDKFCKKQLMPASNWAQELSFPFYVMFCPAKYPEAKWVRKMQITQHYLVLGGAWILPNFCTRLGTS